MSCQLINEHTNKHGGSLEFHQWSLNVAVAAKQNACCLFAVCLLEEFVRSLVVEVDLTSSRPPADNTKKTARTKNKGIPSWFFFKNAKISKRIGEPGHRSQYLSHAKRALYHLS